MTRYRFTLHKNDELINHFIMGENALILGRSSESDLMLRDTMISRKHARLSLADDQLLVEDLESTNGVFVNGQPVVSAILGDGDTIAMGDFSLSVRTFTEELEVRDGETLIPLEATPRILDEIVTSDESDTLRALYRVAQLLTKRFEIDEVLPKILEVVMELMPVHRGFILVRTDDVAKPDVRVSLSIDEKTSTPPLSLKLIDHVYATKSAVLTSSAPMDPRFKGSDSVFRHGIEAAMCVPLYGSKQILGVIYLDSDQKPSPFTTDHLKLITAIGRMIGTVVEDAKLHEENVKNERLAAIGEAVAGLSHYMKNMLTGVKGGTELIEAASDGQDWDRLGRALGIVERSVGRFETLLTDLPSFARKTDLTLAPTHLAGLVDEAMTTVHSDAQKRGVKIHFTPGDLKAVDADGMQLYRVILNLLANAIDACSEVEDGHIEVRTWQDKVSTFLQVSDYGVGIPPENLERISEAFFTTKRGRGTGLGLACSYRIIAQHGGRIHVKSTPGKGATFTVFLPREITQIAPPPKAVDPASSLLDSTVQR